MARKHTGPAPAGADDALTRGAADARYLRSQKWANEIVVNNAPLADGYNDGDGGVTVDAPVTLLGMVWRVGKVGQLVTGASSAMMLVELLAGDSFGEGAVIATANVPVGTQALLINVNSVALTVNAVLRCRHTLNGTGVAGKVHVQYRGVYT